MYLVFGMLLTFFAGYLLLITLKARLNPYELLVLSVVVGLGLMTQLLFLLEILNISFSIINIFLSLIVINFVLSLLNRKRILSIKVGGFMINIKGCWNWLYGLSRTEKVMVIGLIFLILSAFARAFYWPVYYWDALALYDYRARIFTAAEGIAKSSEISSLPLHSYPPMTSLAHTFVYLLGGNLANPQFIYPLFYLAFIGTFYFSLKKYCQRGVSLFMTLFLASIPMFVEFAANAYTNLPYAFYFSIGTIYLYRFFKEEKIYLLLISSILIGLSGWTRSPTEQFFVVNLMVLILWCFTKRKFLLSPLIFASIFSLLAMPWRVYVSHVLHLDATAREVTDALNAGLTKMIDPEKFITVLFLLWGSIKNVSGIVILLVLISIIIFPRKSRKNIYLLIILIFNVLVFIGGSYAFSLSWPDWKDSITNSSNRLSMIFSPVALYYLAIIFPAFKPVRKDQETKRNTIRSSKFFVSFKNSLLEFIVHNDKRLIKNCRQKGE